MPSRFLKNNGIPATRRPCSKYPSTRMSSAAALSHQELQKREPCGEASTNRSQAGNSSSVKNRMPSCLASRGELESSQKGGVGSAVTMLVVSKPEVLSLFKEVDDPGTLPSRCAAHS